MIVRVCPPAVNRWATLECQCGVGSRVDLLLCVKTCRGCRRPYSKDPERLEAARALVRIHFPDGSINDVDVRSKLGEARYDRKVHHATLDVFRVLSGEA